MVTGRMVTPRSSPEESLAVNTLLNTLSHHVRREVIYYFEQTTSETTATLKELITHIESEVPLTTQEELQVSLPHTHLPRLQARDWLKYDTQTDTIEYHGHDDAAESLAELMSTFTD